MKIKECLDISPAMLCALAALALPSLCAQAVTETVPGVAIAEQPPDAGAPTLAFAFEEIVLLAADRKVGETPLGTRNIVPITGGTFEGPRIRGKVLSGGWDWQLMTASGCASIQADYMIQTDDGTIINVLNKGTMCKGADGWKERPLTTPRFEAPIGKHDWLNSGAFVGTLEGTKVDGQPAVRIRFYKAH